MQGELYIYIHYDYLQLQMAHKIFTYLSDGQPCGLPLWSGSSSGDANVDIRGNGCGGAHSLRAAVESVAVCDNKWAGGEGS